MALAQGHLHRPAAMYTKTIAQPRSMDFKSKGLDMKQATNTVMLYHALGEELINACMGDKLLVVSSVFTFLGETQRTPTSGHHQSLIKSIRQSEWMLRQVCRLDKKSVTRKKVCGP